MGAGKSIPSDNNLKKMAELFGVDYSLLSKEPRPDDIISFSFTMKNFFQNVGYSFSYLFWPYMFIILTILLCYIGLGTGMGFWISFDSGNRMVSLGIFIGSIILLSVPLFIAAFKAKLKAQGAVGLAFSFLEQKTVSIDTSGMVIVIEIVTKYNKGGDRMSELPIAFIKKKHGYLNWTL